MNAGADQAAGEAQRRTLEPMERASEVLFGLIMALTFTGSISAASAGREEIRTMLYGAIGCNLAWGIVDAVMYLLNLLTARGHDLATVERVRKTGDPETARRLIADALPPLVARLLRPSEYEHLHQELIKLRDLPVRARLTRWDLIRAAGVLLLVFASTFPLVIPFLFMHEPVRALRTSHAVAVVMLFLIGQFHGRRSGLGAWRMGLSMVGLGLLLVGLTILLGG